MEIKQFKVISALEREKLYNFIKSTDSTYNKTYIEMIKAYESDTFNGGNSIFILFHSGEIKGSAAAITKEISIKGEAFITDVFVERENISNKDVYINTEMFLRFLLEGTVKFCKMCSATSIKIGIRESETYLIPYINKLEFTHIYDAVIMRYRENKNKVLKEKNDVELTPLSVFNSYDYMDMQNEAFKNSPNGGTIDEVEVKDYIVQYANNEELIGICNFEKKPCGIYELSLDDKIGWIDTIGIIPKYQKRGLGKALVEKCIQRLWRNGIDEIKLLVITSNEVAVKMYEQSGFEKERVFSYWFEKN